MLVRPLFLGSSFISACRRSTEHRSPEGRTPAPRAFEEPARKPPLVLDERRKHRKHGEEYGDSLKFVGHRISGASCLGEEAPAGRDGFRDGATDCKFRRMSRNLKKLLAELLFLLQC